MFFDSILGWFSVDMGIDLGTSRTSVSASNGVRETVLSYVGYPKDVVSRKLLGKDVDFYRFPGENHELSRSGSPVHRVQRGEIVLDWFSEKLS